MKKNLKKISLLGTFVLFALASHAQNAFVDSMTTLRDEWIRPAYPIVAGIVFLVGIFMNLGKLFGENRDIKQAVVNILIYLGVVLTVVGVYEAISAVVV